MTLNGVSFTRDAKVSKLYWDIRKGTLPAAGGNRPVGTTVLIEDVAFPVERLAEATSELRVMLDAHGYAEATIFGHALEGNLHFLLAQGFDDQAEIDRYAGFMEALAELVADKYEGSLKAEHGTGRNMAPFVEREWGAQAYALMRRIKALFDPQDLLNPGVLLNDDPQIHLKNLKPMPAVSPLLDRCIECGFCEPQCPSHGLTFSPRQRIVAAREMARLTLRGRRFAATGGVQEGLCLCRRRDLRRLLALLHRLSARHRHGRVHPRVAGAKEQARSQENRRRHRAAFRREFDGDADRASRRRCRAQDCRNLGDAGRRPFGA